MKKIIALLLALVMVFALVACGNTNNPGTESPAPGNSEKPGTTEPAKPTGTVQGISDTEILIGNTAATTGAFAIVGVPFNSALQATLDWYNANGGFNGKKIVLKHYDDTFDAALGTTYTKTLVEDDKVFALVGHFGTNTVEATMDYVKSVGIPTPYIVTGVRSLYAEGLTGKDACYFPIQPIFDAEGRVLLARAVAPKDGNYGLGGTKIGVIATTDDAGAGLLAGVKRQMQDIDVEVIVQEVDASATDYTTAMGVLKNQGCDAVIAAMNQAPVATVMAAMRDINYNVPVITSYVSANATFLGGLVDNGSVTAERRIYTTTWLDALSEQGLKDLTEFVEIMSAWEAANGIDSSDPSQTYTGNSYAMCGYICGKLFIHGLELVKAQGLDLTWENYIAAMETASFHIPMGGDISFANGDRLGVTSLSMQTVSLELVDGVYALETLSPLITLDELMSHIK